MILSLWSSDGVKGSLWRCLFWRILWKACTQFHRSRYPYFQVKNWQKSIIVWKLHLKWNYLCFRFNYEHIRVASAVHSCSYIIHIAHVWSESTKQFNLKWGFQTITNFCRLLMWKYARHFTASADVSHRLDSTDPSEVASQNRQESAIKKIRNERKAKNDVSWETNSCTRWAGKDNVNVLLKYAHLMCDPYLVKYQKFFCSSATTIFTH